MLQILSNHLCIEILEGKTDFLAKPFDESELAGIADTIRQRAAPDAPGR